MPTEILAVENRRKYHWPEAQLNFWIIIMLAAAAIEVGVFANFMTIQNQMGLGIPWYALSFALLFHCVLTQEQGPPIPSHRRIYHPGLPRLDAVAHQRALAVTRNSVIRILHALRPVVDRLSRSKHTAVRRRQEYQ